MHTRTVGKIRGDRDLQVGGGRVAVYLDLSLWIASKARGELRRTNCFQRQRVGFTVTCERPDPDLSCIGLGTTSRAGIGQVSGADLETEVADALELENLYSDWHIVALRFAP